MSVLKKRSTIYFDPKIHYALRLKSIEVDRSISNLVNDALKNTLVEDRIDLRAFDERANEPLTPFNDFLDELKRDGKI